MQTRALTRKKNIWSPAQTDNFTLRKRDQRICKDDKVIPSECLTIQHRLVVTNLEKKITTKTRPLYIQPRIRWWNLNAKNMLKMREKVASQRAWDLELSEYANMWSKVAGIIRGGAQEVLGVSKGRSKHSRGA